MSNLKIPDRKKILKIKMETILVTTESELKTYEQHRTEKYVKPILEMSGVPETDTSLKITCGKISFICESKNTD